jgi:hypothetical protein
MGPYAEVYYNSLYLIVNSVVRDGIFKLLRSPGLDSEESSLPAYEAWRAGMTTLLILVS